MEQATIRDNLETLIGQRIDNAWDMLRVALNVADVVGYLRVEFAHEGGTRIAEDVCELCDDETHPVFLDWVDPTIDMYPHEGFCNCMDALDQIVAGRVRLRSGEWFGHE